MKFYQLFLINILTNQAVLLKVSDSRNEVLQLEDDLNTILASVPNIQLVFRVNEVK